MSLDDVKQLVLFKLLDEKLPDNAKWVAVDSNGQIGVYEVRPSIDISDNSWRPMGHKAKMYGIFIDRSLIDFHWHDLCFEL